MTARLYDAHNHLQLAPLRGQAMALIPALKRDGVQKMVVNGVQEQDWQDVANLAAVCEMIIPAFGLHPWHAADASDNWQQKLTDFLDKHPFCIGEIGLDRWMPHPDLEKQKLAFQRQLEFARDRGIPATIHCLKAWGLLLEILQRESPFPAGFLLHSYSGSGEMVKPLAELGAYFSFSGYFAHARKEKQREVFRHVPLDRLLVETDAPDMLPPEELRVERIVAEGTEYNHPANIAAVYRFASELFGMELGAFADQVEANFRRLFAAAFSQGGSKMPQMGDS
jgi:TatD DNase family protein